MLHLITLLMGLGFAYLTVRYVRHLPLDWCYKAPLLLVLLAVCFKLQILRLLFPGEIIQEIPLYMHVLLSGLHISIFLWILLSLVLDATYALAWLCGLRTGLGYAWRGAITLGLACVLTGVGIWQALRVPDVRRVEIALPALPLSMEGIRIVQLSDMHISPVYGKNWVQAVVQKVNALNPDIIVFTGDMVDGSPAQRVEDVAPLRQLRSLYGVYACLGNHEYYAGKHDWMQAFATLDIHILYNNHVIIPVGDAQLVLGGITDPVGSGRFGDEAPDVAKAFAHIPDSPGRVKILLAHQPRLTQEAADIGVDMQLSGHTHGGQIYLLAPIVARFNAGFLTGLYRIGGMQLYISNGAGLWGGFPIRLGVDSEIVEVVLRRGA